MATVQHNFADSRFDIYDNGASAGFLQYEMQDGRMCFLLTELAPGLQRSKGIDSVLGEVLDDMHHRRMEVMPFCPMVRAFISSRPEYIDLVPDDQLHRFGFTGGAGTPPAAVPAKS